MPRIYYYKSIHKDDGWTEYNGEEILRSDVFIADIFYEGKEYGYRRVEVLKQVGENYLVYDAGLDDDFLMEKSIIKLVLKDEEYLKRHAKYHVPNNN